jgi:putative transposase
MPDRHLRRLDEIWIDNPIYFITTCAYGRTRRLANDDFHAIAIEVWRNGQEHYEWSIGRYVIMPDHVHLFAFDNQGKQALSEFVGKWKE